MICADVFWNANGNFVSEKQLNCDICDFRYVHDNYFVNLLIVFLIEYPFSNDCVNINHSQFKVDDFLISILETWIDI